MDRQAALAWQTEQDLRCKDCGQPRDETMRPELGPDGKPNPQLIEFNARRTRCQACYALETTSRAVAGIEQIDPNSGFKWWPEQANGVP